MVEKTNEYSIITIPTEISEPEIYGGKIGLLARIFGCWHFKISRPMTIGKQTYCSCADCGARIKFDTETLTTVGDYYFPPQQSLYPNK